PWDAHLNADVGEACEKLGHIDIAQYGYEIAVDNDPENKDLLQKLAAIYESRSNYGKAIECWQRIAKLDPHNKEARSKITGLTATSVMDRGGYEGAKTTQEVRKTAYDDYRPATEKYVPDTVIGPGVSLEADLQRAIRKNPAEKGNYLKLAD